MYARVSTFRVEPAKLAHFAALVRESLLPAVTRQRGYRGACCWPIAPLVR